VAHLIVCLIFLVAFLLPAAALDARDYLTSPRRRYIGRALTTTRQEF